MRKGSTKITVNCVVDDYSNHSLTFAEATKTIGGIERFIRIAVRDWGLMTTQGDDGISRVVRVAVDTMVSPMIQKLLRELEHGLTKGRCVSYCRKACCSPSA